jgi:hypothetical protein
MNIQAEKLKLIEWLVSLQDETIIERIKLLKEGSANNADWWDTISESEKMAIEEGIKDIENGNVVSHEDVRKRYDKWL